MRHLKHSSGTVHAGYEAVKSINEIIKDQKLTDENIRSQVLEHLKIVKSESNDREKMMWRFKPLGEDIEKLSNAISDAVEKEGILTPVIFRLRSLDRMMKSDVVHLDELLTRVRMDMFWLGRYSNSWMSFAGREGDSFRNLATKLYNNLHAFKVAVAAEDTLQAIVKFTN